MAEKLVYIGSVGPFIYDDADEYEPGKPMRGLYTDGSIHADEGIGDGSSDGHFDSIEIGGDLDHDGSRVGLFGASPATKTSVGDLSAWVDVSSGSDSVDLSDLNTKVSAIHNKLQALIDALQSYGLV